MFIKKIFALLFLAALATVTACGSTINSPLTVTSTLPTGVVGSAYSAPLNATGGTTPYTWSIKACSGACNTGLGFNQSGLLSGTPVNAGTSTFTFGVTDATGQTSSAALNITIGTGTTTTSPLAITSHSTLPNGVVGSAYSASLTATGGTTPYTWSIKACSGACNTGLGFNQSGVLSGTPVNAGTSTFTFGVTDAKGQTASSAVNITIGTGTTTTSPLAITSPSNLPSGVVGSAYSASLAATGGTTPYTWSIKACSGACNTGLGFNQSGVLSGTPANAGTSTFTFGVTDAKGQTASAALNITIGTGTTTTSPLAITSPSTLPSGVVGTAYSASLTATGGTTPYKWAVTSCSGVCNTGLSLSQAGVFSGTPASTGTSAYNVTVTDATGKTASAALSITIAASSTSTSPSGANYYVSPTGSNSNPCTQSSPCATPDHAFNLASPGEVVQVAPGTYDYGSGAAQFSKSGTSGSYITVTCATRGACKIQNSVTGNATVVYLSGSYITFDGFEVTNTSSAGNNLGFYVTSSFVNITHNTIHHIETDCGSNGGGGIQIAGSGSSNSDLHNITIDGNLIYDINYRGGSPSCPASTVQSDGILAETAGTGLIVTNNIVYHTSGGWGILVGNPNATYNNVNSVISNNTVFATGNGGIIIVSGNGTTISNNIVANTGIVAKQCGIMVPQGVSVTYANNDLWNNGGGNYCLEWGSSDQSVHSNDISVDPALGTTFVNWQADGSGDYHQKVGSPTIDKGASAGTPPKVDHDGNPRPKGAAFDIGAYEYQN